MSSREFLNKNRHGALPHPDPFITSNSQEVSIIKDFYDSTGSSRVGGTTDSEAWPSLLTGREFTCESRPSLLSASVSHCKMMRSSWPLALFLCCEPQRVYTLSEKEKSERGGDRGSMVR